MYKLWYKYLNPMRYFYIFNRSGHANYFLFLFFLRRSVELNSNSLESYDNIMQSSLGFANPGVVEFLLGKLGIDESNPPSLMRGLQRYSKSVLFY